MPRDNMKDILSLADTLEPNAALFKGDLQKIAKIHVSFYKFYIDFASKCEALVFDRNSQAYLESCVDFLENKKVTKKAIQQSRSNCLKMLESLNDLCASLGCDRKMLAGMHKLIDQAVVDEGKGGTLDLLQQLKNLLNAPGDTNDDNVEGSGNDGRVSPESTTSSAPAPEPSKNDGGIVPMEKYLMEDAGMDRYYPKYNRDVKNLALTTKMNQIMSKASTLCDNSYSGLDNLLAKMKINVPIWNYHVDRVDTIDSSNVMDNMEIFGGNKSVTDAVLYSCPDYLTVGPFDVYVRNKVFVYHCLVNDCNNCMTTSLEFLKLHVKFQHGDSDVDWNCTECELIKLHSSCQKSLDGALDHLAKHHSVKSTYSLAKERLLEINKKIMGEDSLDCPQTSTNSSPENTDLFHCPNRECHFSTNAMAAAFGHYAGFTDTVKCFYCPLISYSAFQLCEHLLAEHGNANYKCAHCLYRSVSKTNCVYHQRDVHPELPRKILGVEPLPRSETKYPCRAHNSIKPFVCDEECNFGTMVVQKFNQHILTHPGMTVRCHYCEIYQTDDMCDLMDHFLNHGVGEYHCLYCKTAFNFITKVEQHLHEHHPSQYPFFILCQDYETRCHNLKGKYEKVHKLDIGDESIIVLSLESDCTAHSVNVVTLSETIVIQDVDHCKMQLKTFMKNTEEPEEMPFVPPLPHVEEIMDLTEEDPKDRMDVKPRLRVRTVEELMKSAQVEPEPTPEVATFYAFDEPSEPLLTPAQIKQERNTAVDVEECALRIQIKKETFESRPAKSPLKLPKSPVKAKPVNVKMEREFHMDAPDEHREDQDAVAMLILQEAPVAEPVATVPASVATVPASVATVPASVAAVPASVAVVPVSVATEPVSVATVPDETTAPILSEASISDVPVDFDCAVPDTKQFNVEGIVPLYTDPTVVDTVIISSEGEDDFDDRSSCSTPSSSRSTTPRPAGSPKKPTIRIVSKLTKITPPAQLPSQQQPQIVLIGSGTQVQTQVAAIRSAPIEVRRYRCKLCPFSSEDRQVTYNHLIMAHPKRFSKPIRDVTPRSTLDDAFVQAVSCPYCPDVVYEGIKSFERHHAQHHCDFTEVKCFLVYNPSVKQHLPQIFACCFCGHFCRNEDSVWQHVYAAHATKVATLKKPLHLKFTVAFKKMVCPLYNCLDEFLDPTAFVTHVNSHPQVIACKKCTYIADSVEEFQKFHLKIPPEDRLLHFYYTQSLDDRKNLLTVQRFSNPLYSLSAVHFKAKTTKPSASSSKSTARKSTGGSQYKSTQ